MNPPDTGARYDAPSDRAPMPEMAATDRIGKRIYYAHPLLMGRLDGWDRHFGRIAAMGFDAILLAPPFRPGRFGHLFLTADHARLHPALGEGRADRGLREFADIARGHGLVPMLDVVLDRMAIDAELVSDRQHMFARDGGGVPLDPRISPENANAAFFAAEALRGEALAFWTEQLTAWAQYGIGGFRFVRAHVVAGSVWRTLAARLRMLKPAPVLLADTLGATDAAMEALGEGIFDRATSSSCFWDYRAPWLADDARRVATVAPPLALAEAPFGTRLVAAVPSRVAAEHAAARAAAFAAATGASWLMPMGFEYGATQALDPIRGGPEDWACLQTDQRFDLAARIAAINRDSQARPAPQGRKGATLVSPPDDPVAVLMLDDSRANAALVAVNASLEQVATLSAARLSPLGRAAFAAQADVAARPTIELQPAEVLVLDQASSGFIQRPRPTGDGHVVAAAQAARIAIEAVQPSVDQGRFPVKRIVGETVSVQADIICDGHDQLRVNLLWRPADETAWHEVRMVNRGNDRWTGAFPLSRVGRYFFTVEAWRDTYATFTHELHAKHAAGVSIALETEEGIRLVERAAAFASAQHKQDLTAQTVRLRAAAPDAQLAILLGADLAALMAAADTRPFRTRHEPECGVDAERVQTGFASWYELFPRSMTDDPQGHGTFLDVIARLPAIRAMGFDVLYFPPIHPIGRTNRKGRNNSLTPGPDDLGSPYAIGSAEGGHDAIHPQLGTLHDFRRLRDAAAAHGLELALDFAIQCAPDHPWLREHPEWFAFRADGSLRYAENPPKKYEDITNVDFYAEGAIPSLWQALRDVVLFWAREGVMTFRVDNPHTKPLPFWEWLILEVRAQYPQAIFLAEAFTRPKVMYRLAKAGFSQSYTYFTWRNTKRELTDYLTEIAAPPVSDFFRPHFFVNTPDINPLFLQNSGRPGFLIRAALAATLSGLWGVYSGFELCEAAALPGREEYLDSEKYQVRVWDWKREGNIIPEITMLNRIRRDNPALQTQTGITFHNAFNDSILYFEKATPGRENVILVAVNLDPHAAQDADIELPLWRWSLPDDGRLHAQDLMRGDSFVWHGKHQHIRLDPAQQPFAIWRVKPTA